MTAYVVAGLAQAKAAGVQVDAERIENGAEWLGKSIRRPIPSWRPTCAPT